ncbi:MAG: hypothetical protein HEP71_31320 [Roseivirga sp.]|nr:hypothetical protein [Roseivirga sp.]
MTSELSGPAGPVSSQNISTNRFSLFNLMDMKTVNKNLIRFCMLLLLLGGVWHTASAQLEEGEGPGGPGGSFTITGPTSSNLNESKTYTISGAGISSVSWIVSKGIVTSSNNSSATVTWNQTGTGNIYALVTNTSNQTDPVDGVFVTITNPAPPVPPAASVSALNNCGVTTLSRSNPPSGITWYWQGTNSNGTSTANSSASYAVTTAGTYYLRARNSSGVWSTSSRGITATIDQVPGTPGTVTVSNNCGNTVLTRPNPPSGTTYYWQSSSSGTSTSNSSSSITRTSGSTYYLRARNNSSACWSTARTVNFSVNAVPSTPPAPSVSNNCGNTVLTRANPPSGHTYYWQSSSSGTSTSNSASSITRTSGSTYYLRSRNNSTGCWSSIRTVSYSVNAVPSTPPTPSVSNNCGNTVLTRANPPSGHTYYWQSSSSGTSTSNSSSSVTRTSGSTYYLRSRNNSTGCWSSIRTVSYTLKTVPSTPPAPTVTNNCGNTVLTRSNPGPETAYYWQSSASGTSTSNSASSITRTSGSTYYLRAYNTTSGCWSSARTISYSINTAPATPPEVIIGNNCGNTDLIRSNPPSGITYYWQSSVSGTSTSNSATTLNRTSGSVYYLRARNNSTHCWSGVRTINYSIDQVPSTPPSPSVSNNCGNTVLTRSNPASGFTYYWQSSSSGTSTSNSASSVTRTSGSTYYLRARNNSTHCWSPARTISYSINSLPATPPVPSVSENCNNTVLTRANPPSGFTYYWQSSGSGTSTSNSASMVNRSSAGTYYLRARNNSTHCWGTAVAVTYGFKPLPATPPIPSVAENCGNTVLTRSNPPSGFTYYWQSSSSGTSTSNSASTVNRSSAGTYYLRARNNSTGCWSPIRSVNYGFKVLPATPAAPSVAENCGVTVLTRSNPPSGFTYYWQSTGSGTSTANAFSSINLFSAGTYYLRARNNSTLCWGTAVAVSYGFKTPPSTPPVPTVTENCDNTVLTRANPPSGITYYWQSTLSGTSTSNSASTVNRSSAGTYYLRARNNSTQCWGTATAVTYGFKALPATPPTPTVTENCDNTVLTRANPPSGITYYWQSSGSGTSTSSSASTVNRSSAGTYYLRARNNNTQCWGTAVAVSYGFNALPSAPPVPSVGENCNNTVLTRANPPSGITYYWQNVSSGNSTSNSASTVNRSNAGTYYLRARNNSTHCWGPVTAVSYGFNALPATPPAPTAAENCGTTVLTRSNPPSGITYYWQTTASGTSTANSSSSLSQTAGGTYYLRARNNATHCWSGTSSVTYGFKAIPATPTTPVVTQNFGTTTLSRSNPPSGITWYWQGTNASGTATTNTSTNYTVTTPGTYYLRGRSSSGCWGPSVALTATVELTPQITVTGDTNLAGLGDKATLSTVGVYATYIWKKDGIAVGTGSSYEAREAGSYTLTVTKTGVSGSGVSAAVVVTGSADIDPGDHNYVISTTVLTDGVTTESEVNHLTSDNRTVAIGYADGLGRPTQTIGVEASPTKQHMVQAIDYDIFGRQTKAYLPYTTPATSSTYQTNPIGTGTGDYTLSPQYQFYQNAVDVAHDTAPYAESVPENAPGGRGVKQGAPGSVWQPVPGSYTDHVVRMTYEQNAANEILHYKMVGDVPVSEGYYGAGELTLVVTADENGNEVVAHSDKLGRVILKLVFTGDAGNPQARTQYVYDDYGNLRVVLPPEANKAITAGNLSDVPAGYTLVTSDLVVTPANYTGGSYIYVEGVSVTVDPAVTLSPGAEVIKYGIQNDFLDKWAFQYKYDQRQRMSEKRVPGSGWVYMVYDDLDRLVATQDANQRGSHQWIYTKYDVHSRPVVTGFYTSDTDQKGLQVAVDTFYTSLNRERYEVLGTMLHGYTDYAFPKANAGQVLTVTYYDNYANLPSEFSNFSYVQELGNGINNLNVKGQVVGTKTRILGTSTLLKSVVYYDNRYRVIQTITDHQLSDADRTTTRYDFAGRVVETKRHHATPQADTDVTETFTYDHTSRLLQATHQVNNAPAVILVKNEYNELGELIDKKLHSADNSTSFEQSIDYLYNIRGWLTSINNITLTDGEGDYFGMQLVYERATGMGNTPTYNGNISGAKWSNYSAGNTQRDGYNYSYDPMNRLTAAEYRQKIPGIWVNKTDFDIPGISYDLNGNILSLTRNHGTGTAMDDLSYSYTGNQLLAVSDAGDISEGFKDGNTVGNDYVYDENGNMISDANKDITSISYNHLNLPEMVTFTGGRSITYTYDAAGIKLTKSVNDNGSIKTTDYVGGFIYEDDVMQQMAHAEGRVRRKDSGSFVYDYYLKDHLGNTRITFTTENEQVIYLATMETDVSGQLDYGAYEESIFLNLPATRVSTPAIANNTAEAGITNNETARLRGNDPLRQTGPAKLMQVSRGDVVNLEAYAYYTGTYTDNGSINSGTFITSLISAVTGAAPTGAETSAISGAINGNSATVFVGSDGNNTQPRAYLNYILFDMDFNYIDAGFDQVSSAAKDGHEQLTLPALNIAQGGYLYVYVSNESNNSQDVYFDDLRITHTKGKVLQEDHYYPFGSNISALSSTAPLSKPNQFKYNGKEEQVEFDMNIYDYGARNYDTQLGRFFNIDRFSEKYMDQTPYHYTLNNPLKYVDINGDSVGVSTYTNGDFTQVDIYFEFAVLNSSAKNLNMNDLLGAIESQLTAAYSTLNTEGGETVVSTITLKSRVISDASDLKDSEHLIDVRNSSDERVTDRYGVSYQGGSEILLNANLVGDMISGADKISVPHEVGHAFGLEHPDKPLDVFLWDRRQYMNAKERKNSPNNVMFSGESGLLNNQTSTVLEPIQLKAIGRLFDKGKLNKKKKKWRE